MTHPTPEQERAAEERLRSAIHEYAMPDGGPTPRANVESSDLAVLLSVVERQREALEEAHGTIFALAEFIGAPTDTDDEPCDDLCGNPICASVGCIPMKLRTLAALGESND